MAIGPIPEGTVSPAPMRGEHPEQVLRDVLGYSREKAAQRKEERVSNKTV